MWDIQMVKGSTCVGREKKDIHTCQFFSRSVRKWIPLCIPELKHDWSHIVQTIFTRSNKSMAGFFPIIWRLFVN